MIQYHSRADNCVTLFTFASSLCMYDHRYSRLAPNGWTWRKVDIMPAEEKRSSDKLMARQILKRWFSLNSTNRMSHCQTCLGIEDLAENNWNLTRKGKLQLMLILVCIYATIPGLRTAKRNSKLSDCLHIVNMYYLICQSESPFCAIHECFRSTGFSS